MNFIDLFAGASGMSEGFIRSGFTCVAHVEANIDACNTIKTRVAYHHLNSRGNLDPYFAYLEGDIDNQTLYNEVPEPLLETVINEEITDDSIQHIIDNVKASLWKGGKSSVDLIIGGPPCQAYSIVNRHEHNIERDPRNYLYVQYGRFLKAFRPRGFVFENVPGLLNANGGQYFRNLKQYFRKTGYEVHHAILDAAEFGVLQSRKRVIIVGWRKNDDFGFPDIPTRPSCGSINQLFADLPLLEPGEVRSLSKYKPAVSPFSVSYGLRNGLAFVTQNITRSHNANDLKIYGIAIDKWNEDGIRLKYTDLPKALRTHRNLSSFLDRYKVVNGKGLSHTLVAHIAKDGHYYIHPDRNQQRSISIREAARIQSFPDDFYFEGSRTSIFTQIGNAVPPKMAESIANAMKGLLIGHPDS